MCPKGTQKPPQLKNTPQLMADNIQYKYISHKMYMPQPCARRAPRHFPNWIYSANNCGVLFSWGVSVCPSGTGLGHVHFLALCLYWIYSANNCCVFSWGVSVGPLGTWLGHVHVLRYVFVLDIFCQQLWGVVHLGGVCVPFGHKVGSCTFS